MYYSVSYILSNLTNYALFTVKPCRSYSNCQVLHIVILYPLSQIYTVDTNRYNVNLYSFAYALGKPTFNVLFWAVTIIDCPEEMSNVRLSVGSNSASIWWVNDKEVVTLQPARSWWQRVMDVLYAVVPKEYY